MRKLTVLLFMASLAYIVFAGSLYFSYQNRIREQYLSCPEQIRPFVDFELFSGSREGVFTIVVGAIMGMAWVLHLSRHKRTVTDGANARVFDRISVRTRVRLVISDFSTRSY